MVRCESLSLLVELRACETCTRPTEIFGLFVEEGQFRHEPNTEWTEEHTDGLFGVAYVFWIPKEEAVDIAQMAPNFRIDPLRKYYRTYCRHCGQVQRSYEESKGDRWYPFDPNWPIGEYTPDRIMEIPLKGSGGLVWANSAPSDRMIFGYDDAMNMRGLHVLKPGEKDLQAHQLAQIYISEHSIYQTT